MVIGMLESASFLQVQDKPYYKWELISRVGSFAGYVFEFIICWDDYVFLTYP